jgi:DNA-binding CsgD family transcriptional regulator
MPDEQQVLGLIGQIYDAAAGDEDWAEALGGLSRMLDGRAAVLQRPAAADRPVQTAVAGIDHRFVGLYGAHYHRLLPIRHWLPRLPGGTAFIDRMLVPDEDYIRTEFYTDFLQPQDQHASVSWVSRGHREKDWLPAIVSIWRSRRDPDWEPVQLRLLQCLGPHLERALEIERRLEAAATHRLVRDLAHTAATLTLRERDCLAEIAQGASSKDIARRMALSPHAINGCVESAMRKLEAASRSEAVAKALVLGLIED